MKTNQSKPSLSYYLLFTDATDLFTRFYWEYSLYIIRGRRVFVSITLSDVVLEQFKANRSQKIFKLFLNGSKWLVFDGI